MEKRSMLTFSAPARLVIESASSGLLLFGAGYLTAGIFQGRQTPAGNVILLVFAVVFAVGGVLGAAGCIRKYRAGRDRGAGPGTDGKTE